MKFPVDKARRIVRTEGWRGVAQRAARSAYRHFGADDLDFPLLPGDIADSRRLTIPISTRSVPPSGPLTIGWVCTPPGIGSGGHTTMFRMVSALEAAGHTCVIYLYDRYGGDTEQQRSTIRTGWPQVRAEVVDSSAGIRGLDGCVATSWSTAHAMVTRMAESIPGFYFIQDFEPFFTARGSEYELAEDTYRFGLHNIALGHMVGDCLTSIGVPHDVVEFGCDTATYHLLDDRPTARSGVVFYTRPGVPRRGFLLGCLALAEFHRIHPEHPIHLYGAPAGVLPFPTVDHGGMSPTDLNTLYNTVIAGIAMSFTNISLVAEEMLAAGAIPVINDSPMSRADLANPHAAWAAPTASGIAEQLSAVVRRADREQEASRAALSVRADNWEPTGNAVVAIIEQALRPVT